MASAKEERTFFMIKPNGVQRGFVGKIIKRFEGKGFKLVGLKFMRVSEELLKKHYSDLADQPFFSPLIKYMSSGPVVLMVWEGLNVIKTGRMMLGATDPKNSAPGSIRGDLCIQDGRCRKTLSNYLTNLSSQQSIIGGHMRNVIHGSDSVESANEEISLWFDQKELVEYSPDDEVWVYEK